MKNPQTILHKDGIWIARDDKSKQRLDDVMTNLRRADTALSRFHEAGMGVAPMQQEFTAIQKRLFILIDAMDQYKDSFEDMDIRDGIPDPRETSLPIPEIAD